MSTLHVDSLTKSYDSQIILSDVFISCSQGEIIGLIGRNGSGKSTLLKTIFGATPSDSKFIRVGEKVIKKTSDNYNLIHYLPQDNFLPNNVKIKTLIKLFLPHMHHKALLNNEVVSPLLHKKSQELSGGERRIIELLLVINSNAKFILLDEPFNGVSPVVKEKIIAYIKTIKPSKGFIITDHDYETVISLADRLIYLKNGSIKAINDKSELIEFGYLSKTTYNATYN